MTADEASALPSSAGDQAGTAKRVTHRLLCPDKIRDRFRHRPAVAELILAIREELERELGKVDTLREFARRVKAKRPKSEKSIDRLRHTFSEQLTTAPGPSSTTILYVLDDVVTADRREEVQQRFNTLYTAVRGEPLPYAEAPVATPMPRQAEAPVAESVVPDPATTAELRELVTELHQMISARDAMEAALRTELAARTEEVARLRRNLGPIDLFPTPARRGQPLMTPQRDTPPRQNRGRRRPQPASPPNGAEEDIPILWPPPDRYAVLAALNEQAASTWTNTTRPGLVADELEDYWHQMYVASQFGAIARELSREGLGDLGTDDQAPTGPDSEHPAPDTNTKSATRTAKRSWDWLRRLIPHRSPDRIPRAWSSRGPAWFYALLGGIAVGGAASVTCLAFLLPPAPPPPPRETNPVWVLIDERYP